MRVKLLIIVLSFFGATVFAQTKITISDNQIDKLNATVGVRKIIDFVEDNTTIIFPKGVYHFYEEGAAPQFCAITNNDNGVKKTPFPLIYKKNITIDGGGSEFIFHQRVVPFIIENSTNIEIKNLSIDWATPFHLEAEVIAVDSLSRSFTMKVRDGFEYRVVGDELRIVGDGWEIAAGQNIFWDPATKAPYYNTQTFNAPAKALKVREVEAGVVEMLNVRRFPPVGAIYIDKGQHLQNRVAPAVRIYKAKNTRLIDMNIYHSSGIAVIGERSEDIFIDNMTVTAKEGRYISTTADATHFCNCKGLVTIQNSSFSHMLDDATNVHGTYLRIIKTDGQKLYLEPIHPHQYGYDFGERGDSIAIVNNQTLERVGKVKICEIVNIHDRLIVITTDKNVEDISEVGFCVDNLSYGASLTFVNNRVFENRARSILISTPGEVLVENNYFSSMMAGIFIGGDLNFWLESGPVSDVVIRNNTFEDCCYGGGRHQAVIMVNPNIELDKIDPNRTFHRNIKIVDNRIKTFDSPILYVQSIDGLTFKNNSLETTNSHKPFNAKLKNIEIIGCRDVVIEGNKRNNSQQFSIKADVRVENIRVEK